MEQRFTKIETRLSALEATTRRMASEVASLRSEVASSERRLSAEISANTSLILQRFDAFLPAFEANRRERSVADAAYLRHQDRLDDHEARLSRLESRKK